MPDAFLTYAYDDQPIARGLADDLAGRGLVLGPPVDLWPQMPLVKLIDAGLADSRHAVVLVSPAFLKLFSWRRDLDALAARRRVVSLLHGLEEADLAGYSPRLAVAAIPGAMAERLVRLLRRGGPPEGDGDG